MRSRRDLAAGLTFVASGERQAVTSGVHGALRTGERRRVTVVGKPARPDGFTVVRGTSHGGRVLVAVLLEAVDGDRTRIDVVSRRARRARSGERERAATAAVVEELVSGLEPEGVSNEPPTEMSGSDVAAVLGDRNVVRISIGVVAAVVAAVALLCCAGAVDEARHIANWTSGARAAGNLQMGIAANVNVMRAAAYFVPMACLVGILGAAVRALGWGVLAPRIPRSRGTQAVGAIAAVAATAAGAALAAIALLAPVEPGGFGGSLSVAGWALLGLVVTVAGVVTLRQPAFRTRVRVVPIGVVAIAAVAALPIWAADSGPMYGDALVSYSLIPPPPGSFPVVPFDVTCVTPGHCIATGLADPRFHSATAPSTLVSDDGGRTWRAIAAGGATDPLLGSFRLRCPTTQECLAARPDLESTHDGGRTWRFVSLQSTPALSSVWAVACMSSGRCVVAWSTGGPGSRTALSVTDDSGRTFQETAFPMTSWSIRGLSCAQPSLCVAVGSTSGLTAPAAIAVSRDGGRTWHAVPAPASVPILSDVTCVDAEHCEAVGSTRGPGPQIAWSVVTSDGGESWSAHELPGSGDNVIRVACPTITSCLALGQASGARGLVMFATSDGGATWNTVALPPPSRANVLYFDLTCASGGTCVVAGIAVGGIGQLPQAVLAYSADGGRSWQRSQMARSGTR